MGLFKLFSDTKPGPPLPPNPDPRKYKIIKHKVFNGHSILEVHYDGCTTFNGVKLLLMKGVWKEDGKPLDPHFLHAEHPILARFEPTDDGWVLAKHCALFEP